MARERNDSPNIKAVIFDYGLVLVRSPKTEEFGRMAQIFNVGFKLFYQLWESSRDLYDRGDISAEEYWLRLAAKTKTSIDPAQIEFLRKVTFDFKTFSAEVRMIKPDPAIYEHTLQGLGVSATEALFLDDREPNIRAARMLGIHAIQFSSVEQLKNDLEALGFPVLPAVTSSDENPEDRPPQEVKFQL